MSENAGAKVARDDGFFITHEELGKLLHEQYMDGQRDMRERAAKILEPMDEGYAAIVRAIPL